jgi:hypothetical protein
VRVQCESVLGCWGKCRVRDAVVVTTRRPAGIGATLPLAAAPAAVHTCRTALQYPFNVKDSIMVG